jgi:fatty-acyl-CoA synthase
MSETGPLLTLAQLHPHLGTLDEESELHFRTKAGAPLPLVELRTVDEDLRDIPAQPGATGEVVARSPWLTQGYLGQPQASAELWQGGCLHTRDIGFLERGYLKVTDRLKDVIKTGGEWISSVQIEDLISQHPAVAEVAVIGVPDPRWGERPLALVVLRPGTTASEDELRQVLAPPAARGTISKWAVPDRVLIVDAIARTSVGKFDKKRLREQYAGYGRA